MEHPKTETREKYTHLHTYLLSIKIQWCLNYEIVPLLINFVDRPESLNKIFPESYDFVAMSHHSVKQENLAH
jgi:hypothetical protein